MMANMLIPPLTLTDHLAIRTVIAPGNRFFLWPPQKIGKMLYQSPLPDGADGAVSFHIDRDVPTLLQNPIEPKAFRDIPPAWQ